MSIYHDSTALLNAIYNSATDFAIFTLDKDGIVTSWNVGAERVLGYTEKEVIGQHSAIFFTAEDRDAGQPWNEIENAKNNVGAQDYRWHLRKDGSRFWADGMLTVLHDKDGVQIGYLKIMKDITEKKLAEEKMQYLATIDALTGLANRAAFDTRLAEMMSVAVRSNQLMVLQLLDLDYFKQINDSLGHHAGDMLLRTVAERIRRVMREGDFTARLGGDEFAIVQMNMPSPEAGAYLAGKLI